MDIVLTCIINRFIIGKVLLHQDILNTVLMKVSPEWKNRAENFSNMVAKIRTVEIDMEVYESASPVIWASIEYINDNKNIMGGIETITQIALM